MVEVTRGNVHIVVMWRTNKMQDVSFGKTVEEQMASFEFPCMKYDENNYLLGEVVEACVDCPIEERLCRCKKIINMDK